MRAHGDTGQAAVEGIGVTVVVALLLAAVASWLLSTTRPPARPPDLVGRVAQPLGGPYDPRLWAAPSLPSILGLPEDHRGSTRLGRVLRAVGRGAVTGVVVGVQARNQFIEGMAERFQERTVDLVRHPFGAVDDLPDGDAFTLHGLGLAGVRRAGELWDYARFLWTLPPRAALMRASRDAGRTSADALIQIGLRKVRRRTLGGGRRRPPPPPPPGERVPPPAP